MPNLRDSRYLQDIQFGHTDHGAMFWLPQDTYVGGSLRENGIYSPDECRLLRKILQPEWVAFDCGANMGTLTLEMARKCKKVISIEPQYLINQLLRANVAINDLPNVEVLYNAVGATPGEVLIPVLDYNHPVNYGAVGRDNHWGRGQAVEQVTIDGIVVDLQLPSVNFLKVDVEGMEKEVLMGAVDTIKHEKPLLYVENDRQDKAKELVEYIYSLDYIPYWVITLVTRNEKSPFFGQCSFNMLCVPPEGRNRVIVEQLNKVDPENMSWEIPLSEVQVFE